MYSQVLAVLTHEVFTGYSRDAHGYSRDAHAVLTGDSRHAHGVLEYSRGTHGILCVQPWVAAGTLGYSTYLQRDEERVVERAQDRVLLLARRQPGVRGTHRVLSMVLPVSGTTPGSSLARARHDRRRENAFIQ